MIATLGNDQKPEAPPVKIRIESDEQETLEIQEDDSEGGVTCEVPEEVVAEARRIQREWAEMQVVLNRYLREAEKPRFRFVYNAAPSSTFEPITPPEGASEQTIDCEICHRPIPPPAGAPGTVSGFRFTVCDACAGADDAI
jgi:hypothetical protein